MVHLSLLAMAAMWGSNFVAIKQLLRTLDPLEVVLLRLTLASLCFAVVLLASAGSLPRFSRAEWRRLAVIGVLGITINTTGVAFGTRMIPAALASLIVTTNPVFTALLARGLLGEPLTRRKLLGIAVAFAGVLLVLLYGGPEAHFDLHNALGVLVMLLGPSAWALYTVFSKPFLARCPPTQFAGIVVLIGTLPLLPVLLVEHRIVGQVAHFGALDWLATLETAGLALVVAYTIWYRGLRVLSPTQLAVYNYLVPVFGVLGAWVFLGERITIFLLLGGLTILTGVVLTNSGRGGRGLAPVQATHAGGGGEAEHESERAALGEPGAS
ncbi:MAG TPA: DMT family transporter [Thermomicrobiaceae bacterium]|nr:DMT family transporter [Thermomicrobiaceae bacterium]